MLNNIPLSMREYEQWIVYRVEKKGALDSKVPYCPQLGIHAATNNPSHWTTFDHAVSILQSESWYDGLGFVLTHDDPFCFIDLDSDKVKTHELMDYHNAIAASFDTYKEISPSGIGLHIIAQGSVPAGRKSSHLHVECYSSGRYMTMTGNVVQPGPIKMQQANISHLWEQLKPNPKNNNQSVDVNSPETRDDLTVYNAAAGAANGSKFVDLWNGNYTAYYPSQSEADLSLCNIIAYYTQNRDQIGRMFRMSGLGQRDKAKRDSYLFHEGYGIVTKSLDQAIPAINLDGIYNELAEIRATLPANPMPLEATQPAQEPLYVEPIKAPTVSVDAPTGWHDATLPRPPGLMGLIADFILSAANRPVPEIAIAGSMALMAGICGRAYNIRGTGLNQYLMLIARTGRGKDAIEEGLTQLFDMFAMSFPQTADFLGSGDFSSGPGLITALINNPVKSFVSIMDEFGLKLQALSKPNAFGPDLSFKKLLLILYMQSGKKKVFRPTAYADVSRNAQPIRSPAVTIVGNSQPEVYYPGITELSVKQGLIPRFITIHYSGKRPPKNEWHDQAVPSEALHQQLSTLFGHVLQILAANQPKDVERDPEAIQLLRQFDHQCDDLINAKESTIVEDLYTRADLKVLKLAALVAVGVSPGLPVITRECFEFAKAIVVTDINVLTDKFHAGEIGDNQQEFAQMERVKKVAIDYVISDYSKVATHNVAAAMHNCGDIPHSYFYRRLSQLSIFKSDVIGAARAIKRALQNTIDNGDIMRYTQQETRQKYNTDGNVYAIANVTLLTEARAKKFAPSNR